jgi:hypothetical protein
MHAVDDAIPNDGVRMRHTRPRRQLKLSAIEHDNRHERDVPEPL